MGSSGKSERILLYVCIAILAAAGYDLGIQYAAVPACMRYIPPESAAYVVTSPLGPLWRGASPHLEQFFPGGTDARSEAAKSAVEKIAVSLKRSLDEKHIVLAGPDDLPGLGIDPASNAAAAIVGSGSEPGILLVVPLVDRDRFKDALARYLDTPVALVEPKQPNGDRDRTLYKAGDLFLAFGDDDTALLSSDDGLLRRVLDSQNENLAYFRSSDRLIRGFAALLPGRQGASAAWLRGSISVAGTAMPVVREMQFVLAADRRAALFRARVALPDERSELVARLLAQPRGASAPADRVLARSNGAAVLADDSVPYYLRYFAMDPVTEALAGFNRVFPGLIDELRTSRTLRQVSFAASGESQRVPGVIFGFPMSGEEAKDLLFRLQQTLRLNRDREILRAAADRYRAENDQNVAAPVTIDTLLATGLLSPQRDPLWARYRFKDGKVEPNPNPALRPEDFATESYRKTQAQFNFRYILPPVTDDDLAYRFSSDKVPIDGEDLKRDKYRACSSYVDDTLWLGNDAEVLGQWLARLDRTDLAADYVDASAYTKEGAGAKLRVFMRPRELLDSGQLYPDSRVNDRARRLLSNFGQYRALLASAATNGTEREVYVSGTFLLF